SKLLAYATLEGFDYIVSPYARHHLHWFKSAGFPNLAWLPLISMYTVAHEWVNEKESKVVFVGHSSLHHPRRGKLLKSIEGLGVPFVSKVANRLEASQLFAESLISFNCSLNGDFNLRNLEVISAGGFLLTDQLSSLSGFDEYLSPGTYCDTYSSEDELIEKIYFYLENPTVALDIAKKAYEKFFIDWHPNHRINDLFHWVFDGVLPETYNPNNDPRFFVSQAYSHLTDTRLAIYEPVQELHRVEENLKVLISVDSAELTDVVLADLLDLPRLELYLAKGLAQHSTFLEDIKLAHRVHLLDGDVEDDFDVIISESKNLEKPVQVPRAKFVFILGDEGELVFSSAKKLMEVTSFCLPFVNGSQLLLRAYAEDSTNYVVDEIFSRNCYPILPFVPDVKMIVDIGANIGLASAYFRAYYKDASIHCFEVDPLALHLLKQNALSIGNCFVYPVGLYSDDLDKVFYTGSQTAAHSSIHQSSYSGFAQLLSFRKASSFLEGARIAKIDILKIDTEGCELQILRTLFSKIAEIKVIYLEFHSEEDRRLIDQFLSPTHVLWRGNILDAHRGDVCYLNRRCMPQDSPIEPLGR
ncbi:MAG: FkbM family methyltransferase, partial [Thermostichus sp. DRC_bins_24]